ncbi:MaoC family dehydratase [Pseudoclavibacter endophyticus]|uniref:MaoC family dehydratase n=1 Tax=Pseudoclavibacter endophyticus TaxID=1778590 RepID=A0A6H9WP39_9MICO|nr:MaoC family dehydratase [Pseudoclavibacter endophyticus]KAB1648386.1 MaoC family dehydratase [Pseudoclavibacter endophyticus]GGA72256.1 MaoC family dehydratase [Pseudoclavibacter endophyticus]
MAKTVVTFDELAGLEGRDLGASEWIEITQERINTFADATDDHQWIHTDVEKAAAGPFGAPIAHGFLTLSLIIPLYTDLFDVEGASQKINYGLNKVRFTSPVKVGSKVRMLGTIGKVEEVKGGYQVTVSATIEIEGEERPGVVAEFLGRFYK